MNFSKLWHALTFLPSLAAALMSPPFAISGQALARPPFLPWWKGHTLIPTRGKEGIVALPFPFRPRHNLTVQSFISWFAPCKARLEIQSVLHGFLLVVYVLFVVHPFASCFFPREKHPHRFCVCTFVHGLYIHVQTIFGFVMRVCGVVCTFVRDLQIYLYKIEKIKITHA